MISTQRIIIMFVMINILTATAITIYEGGAYTPSQLNTFNTHATSESEQAKNMDSLQSNPRTDVQIDEASWILKLPAYIKSMAFFFGRAIWPFSISPTDFNTTLEKMFATILCTIRSFIMFLVILEIFSYYRNKKAP